MLRISIQVKYNFVIIDNCVEYSVSYKKIKYQHIINIDEDITNHTILQWYFLLLSY